MKIIKLDATDSTNSYLKTLLNKDSVDDLTVVISKHQKNGRGRNGSIWVSDPSLNLAFSIYKKFENLSVSNQFYLNIISSISVFELLKKYKVQQLTIKWPNDIMTANKKISGILIENNLRGSLITHSIIGVGINVNQTKFKDLPNATSILNKTGFKNSLDDLANDLISIFKRNLNNFQSKINTLSSFYNQSLYRKNIKTEFIDNQKKSIIGEIVSVDEKGILKLKKLDGHYENFMENEIKMKI